MQAVLRYQTFDGKLHDDVKAAHHHLDVLYGDAMAKVSHPLCRMSKYTETGDFINLNLHLFLELHKIREDRAIENITED